MARRAVRAAFSGAIPRAATPRFPLRGAVSDRNIIPSGITEAEPGGPARLCGKAFMKSDKAPLKKTVKKITQAVQKTAAAMGAGIKKAKVSAAAKKETSQPAVAEAPEPKAKRKPAAKKPALSVPPILLEGDRPAALPVSGPGQRYALGPVPPVEHSAVEDAELPEAYGTEQLLLTARDPHWLYARWDLTREQQKKYNSLSADRHLVLRIFTDEIKGAPLSQVHVHPESTHWFVDVPHAGRKYFAQLGYHAAGGKWIVISASAATLTPPDSLSDDTTAQFATIPIEIPFAELLELARATVRENIPLADIVQQLRAHGHQVAETGRWTPEQERALGSIISMDRVRRVWMGSLEITELIRRRLQQEMSSLAAAQFSLPTSPIGGISSFSSVSSPFGAAARRSGFWFNVNAELIIYGATEPDAQVTIGGRVIKLRADGTFSYRFILPDGQYELPAVAVSADRTDGRAAELKFSRGTEYRGDVGAHPQDPQLKPPLVANVA
jgi:uncharacterized protein